MPVTIITSGTLATVRTEYVVVESAARFESLVSSVV